MGPKYNFTNFYNKTTEGWTNRKVKIKVAKVITYYINFFHIGIIGCFNQIQNIYCIAYLFKHNYRC